MYFALSGDIVTPQQCDTTTTDTESVAATAAETIETTTDAIATPPVAAAMTMAQAPPTSYVTASTGNKSRLEVSVGTVLCVK